MNILSVLANGSGAVSLMTVLIILAIVALLVFIFGRGRF